MLLSGKGACMLENLRRGMGLALALVTCPCHLPVTAPLLLGLLAGTALGSYLSTHMEVLAAVSGVLFLGGLVLATVDPGGRRGSSSGVCRSVRSSSRRFRR